MHNIDTLNKIISGSIMINEPMSKHTSYGIGGPAKAYIMPSDKKDLKNILKFSNKNSIKTYFIGSGSNLLVSDRGIDGIVINLRKSFKELKINKNTIFAESGVMLGKIVKQSVSSNLSGLESLIGVPGTLGGALVMNAGAFGGEISNYLKSVTTMKKDGKDTTYYPNDIIFSYRSSTFPSDEIIISAEFELEKSNQKIIFQKKSKASTGRKDNQPLKYRSAGSIFKNPKQGAAGFFIDQAGLKGTKIGGAEISTKHANFFVNHGKATAKDIIQLIKIAQKKVSEKFGIKLDLEVKTLGFKAGTFKI